MSPPMHERCFARPGLCARIEPQRRETPGNRSASASRRHNMLIRNTSILSFDDLSIRPSSDVLIEGSRIKKIGPNLPASGEVIDGTACYLLPGLVNAHSHTAMTLLRGVAEDVAVEDWFNKHVWMYEKNLTPHDVYIGTLLGAAEMLLNGVTFVADHYFYMDEAFRAYQQAGMRADLSWAAFGVGPDWERAHQEALRFTEQYAGRDSRLTISLGPHSPYLCPDEFLRASAKRAQEMGLKLHIHVSEEERQVTRTVQERGMTPIELLQRTGVLREGTILAHAYWATDSDMQLIRESGAGVAHCPKTYMRFGDIHDFLPRALQAGVSCALGSDG
ncbi:MAG: amidohydrolase family protein, partial [Chloroflexi bacterium]|nr:amidohydrolase family protein [Chloroflexota bacterium]